ncbi:ribonuclease III [Sphingomonas sinipercae]|uniref:Ribonuclease 3 n=1 Tax=Sphingomonas sinipercae TaxID=2714944 RepID=A0A6G7ZQQ0_9SPHN|nr:ribonuclease III [Sphingomonas sinipercae]QIL03317.1 ribonuclease III [Sphingomonas sinipercae]
MVNAELKAFIASEIGHTPADPRLFEAAFTHSSATGSSYERLEFLGDRVLGVCIARLLYERYPNEAEGQLSHRFNQLVARETCGEIGRELGLPAVIRLGKQARDDGANWSDNVVGDVVEALIGALFVDAGLDRAEALVRRLWQPLVDEQRKAPKHPKSALQELAAAKALKNPNYELVRRSGAQHQPRFTVKVTIATLGEAEGEGSSKQEAETAAAEALLEKLQ